MISKSMFGTGDGERTVSLPPEMMEAALQGNPREELWLAPDPRAEAQVETYAADRRVFEKSLSGYIRNWLARVDPGIRLADILTSQHVLAEPVIPKAKFIELTDRLAKDLMGLDNLLMLAGFLSEEELSTLLNGLDLSPSDKESVRGYARQVNNRLDVDEPGGAISSGSAAVSKFNSLVQEAHLTDSVINYAVDMSGPKIFLKKEGDGRLVMIRRMDVENFAAWLKAYEAGEIWRELGFDYVPVEPIQRFVLNRRFGTVDAHTALLDSESFTDAYENADDITKAQFMAQVEAIKQGLDRVGVLHGHLHSDNLQVVVQNGRTRVFVIDFDRALIAKS